jgi:hypothetical protein
MTKHWNIILTQNGKSSKIDEFMGNRFQATAWMTDKWMSLFPNQYSATSQSITDWDGNKAWIFDQPIIHDRIRGRKLEAQASGLIELDTTGTIQIIQDEPSQEPIMQPIDWNTRELGSWKAFVSPDGPGYLLARKKGLVGLEMANWAINESFMVLTRMKWMSPIDQEEHLKAVNLIQAAPEMAQTLETIHAWGDTILSRLTKLEAEIFRDVLNDVTRALESINDQTILTRQFPKN